MDWQQFGGNWSSITSGLRNRWARITRDDVLPERDSPPQVRADTRATEGTLGEASTEDVDTPALLTGVEHVEPTPADVDGVDRIPSS